jgi:hypothetical protein
MEPANDFYVYAYLRSKVSKYGRAGIPYYIGKGWGRRAFRTHSPIPIPNNRANIVLVSLGMSETDAHQLEMLLIHLHGRVDLGTGCLRNLTDGGEGVRGRFVPEEERKAISNRGKQRWASLSEEQKREWHEAIREGWAERTEEQKREYSETISEHRKVWHASLTEEQRREWHEKLKKGWERLPEDEKREWREALKKGHGRRTEEQKRELGQRMSQANQNRWANLTEAEKRDRREAQKKGWASHRGTEA